MSDGRFDRRRFGMFEEPQRPMDFTHHAWLRGTGSEIFDSVVRDWRLRLYEGRVREDGGTRMACLRQGVSGQAAGRIALAGLFVCILGLLAGSELGRDFRQHGRGAGAAHAGLLAPLDTRLPSAALFAAGLSLLAAGAWLGRGERKHIWIVGHAPASGSGVDIWIAGRSSRSTGRFDREFEAFVQRAGAQGVDGGSRNSAGTG